MFVETEERKHGEAVEAPATALDETARILMKAADLLIEYGHCKNAISNSYGNMCVLGAILCAATGDPDNVTIAGAQAHMRLNEALRMSAIYWNNRPERTKAEVIAKLREVALS